MNFRIGLNRIYRRYLKELSNVPSIKTTLDSIPDGKQFYKKDILSYFNQAVEEKDEKLLQFCIGASFRDGINNEYIELFEKLILAEWHEEHEDIVDIVYQFKDDRFTDALEKIALNPEIYRKYDDENESTLRKCFHALKAIDSKKSNKVIEKLIESKNPNIHWILDMYR